MVLLAVFGSALAVSVCLGVLSLPLLAKIGRRLELRQRERDQTFLLEYREPQHRIKER